MRLWVGLWGLAKWFWAPTVVWVCLPAVAVHFVQQWLKRPKVVAPVPAWMRVCWGRVGYGVVCRQLE
jgi:hypothetical protein